jgi:hypothetical protein
MTREGETQDKSHQPAWKRWIIDKKLGLPKIAWAAITAIIGLLVATTYTKITSKSSEEIATEATAKLAAGESIENFRNTLGGPAQTERDTNSFRQEMWINETYAVKAIYNPDDEIVLGFTVTTRSQSFNPEIPFGNIGRLGEARFSDALPGESRAGQFPNGYWFYDEIREQGPRTYETSLLGSSLSGRGHTEKTFQAVSTLVDAYKTNREGPSNELQNINSSPDVSDARNEVVITTYGLLADGTDSDQIMPIFALAPDQVEDLKYPSKD